MRILSARQRSSRGRFGATSALASRVGAVALVLAVSAGALPDLAGGHAAVAVPRAGGSSLVTPADGVSFFLVNGDVSLTKPGAFGGSLGYAQKLPDDNPARPFVDGVDGGYLGVGLDVLGNYFGDWEQRGNGYPARSPAGTGFRVPGPGANMVTVRGPGQGTEGYCFLTATTTNFGTTGPWPSTLPGSLQGSLTELPAGATPEQAENALEPSRRQVNVVVTPGPDPVLTVTVNFNYGTGPHEVLSTPAPQPVPASYKFGFAASTGLFTDVHLIRNVRITTERPLPELNLVKQFGEPLPGQLAQGSKVPYEFVVTNTGKRELHDVVVTDDHVAGITCETTTGPRSSSASGSRSPSRSSEPTSITTAASAAAVSAAAVNATVAAGTGAAQARSDDQEEPAGLQRPDPVVVPGREQGDDHADNDIAPVAGMAGQVKDHPVGEASGDDGPDNAADHAIRCHLHRVSHFSWGWLGLE